LVVNEHKASNRAVVTDLLKITVRLDWFAAHVVRTNLPAG